MGASEHKTSKNIASAVIMEGLDSEQYSKEDLVLEVIRLTEVNEELVKNNEKLKAQREMLQSELLKLHRKEV